MMSDPSFRGTAAYRVLILLITLALVSAGREARATDLTVSNVLPMTTTPPNPPYATVDVTPKSTNVVEITVTPTTNYYSSMGANFGVTNFTFNTNLPVVAADITVVTPSLGWSKVQNPSANYFGTFSWLLTSTRGAKKLVFDVNHTGAMPSNFMIANSKGEMFAANIVNFTVNGANVTSQWVSNAVALHALVKAAIGAAAVLGLLGAGAWFFARHKKAKTQVGRAGEEVRSGTPLEAQIIDRGRGPEIAGTRITVYRIMDFIKYNYAISDIVRELGLADEQVLAAIEYIRAHREEVDREYAMIMDRVKQPNLPEVERGRAKTREVLRQRIRARLDGESAHDHPVGQ